MNEFITTGNCNSCPCIPICPPCREEPPKDPCVICPAAKKAYAYYHQLGRLYNSALFGAIRFEQEPIQTEGFYYDTGVIQIFKPGVYLVTYIVNIPENVSVDTTLALQINNANVPGSVRVISKTETDALCTVTAQAVIQVETAAGLRLSSSKVVNYTTLPENTAASLSVVEL